jgi:hypothetical protein
MVYGFFILFPIHLCNSIQALLNELFLKCHHQAVEKSVNVHVEIFIVISFFHNELNLLYIFANFAHMHMFNVFFLYFTFSIHILCGHFSGYTFYGTPAPSQHSKNPYCATHRAICLLQSIQRRSRELDSAPLSRRKVSTHNTHRMFAASPSVLKKRRVCMRV